jgi:hypothetical protein
MRVTSLIAEHPLADTPRVYLDAGAQTSILFPTSAGNSLAARSPGIFPGERDDVEARCREQAASPCLVSGGCCECPDPIRRGMSVITVVGEET